MKTVFTDTSSPELPHSLNTFLRASPGRKVLPRAKPGQFQGTSNSITRYHLGFASVLYHCDHANDFPLVNGTPGIIQDPIDLLLAKCNFTNKRWMVLVFSTCNTVDLSLGKLHLLFLVFFINRYKTGQSFTR